MNEAHQDPFYEWIDHEEIREMVHRANDLEPGERLVLLKGHVHLDEQRDVNRPGGREAERERGADVWNRRVEPKENP